MTASELPKGERLALAVCAMRGSLYHKHRGNGWAGRAGWRKIPNAHVDGLASRGLVDISTSKGGKRATLNARGAEIARDIGEVRA
jgi:hypothetical protein